MIYIDASIDNIALDILCLDIFGLYIYHKLRLEHVGCNVATMLCIGMPMNASWTGAVEDPWTPESEESSIEF